MRKETNNKRKEHGVPTVNRGFVFTSTVDESLSARRGATRGRAPSSCKLVVGANRFRMSADEDQSTQLDIYNEPRSFILLDELDIGLGMPWSEAIIAPGAHFLCT